MSASLSSITDETLALGDVYAESLLEAAEKSGRHEEIAAEFAGFMAYVEAHPDFEAFLASATIDEDNRRESLEKLFRGKLDDLLLNLLQVLNRRNRLTFLQSVARAVELRMEDLHHQQEVLVETAIALPEDLKARLKERLSQRMGKEALLIEKIRPELIGGVVLHVRDKRLDGSLVHRIRDLRQRLWQRATHEIRKSDVQFFSE